MSFIKPTVGRMVWYHPTAYEQFPQAGDEPLAAQVARVWSDTCVNLCVLDANGSPHSKTSVLLWQEGQPKPDAGYCEWMDYQKGQAAKTEALERQLADVSTTDQAERTTAGFKDGDAEPVTY